MCVFALHPLLFPYKGCGIWALLVIICKTYSVFQYRFDSPQAKRDLVSNNIVNFVYKLPNNLRGRFLGNQEILDETQNWVGALPSPQSPLQK